MAELPNGTVTFLLTDIEGSTRLWEQHPDAMRLALARHDALAAAVVEHHGGTLLKRRGEGDSLVVVFARATNALAAACALQQALLCEAWPTPEPVRVRMALHTGEPELRDGDYYGPALNRCARLRAAGHGGQVLLSSATQELVQEALPPEVSLRDLGTYRLRDLQRPEHVLQALHPDLAADFPRLRSARLLTGADGAEPGRGTPDMAQLLSVLEALRKGDFSARMPLSRSGPAREVATSLNGTLELLDALTTSLGRMMRVTGVRAALGSRLQVPGAEGRWKDLVDDLNLMRAGIADYVQDLLRVMRSLADGDFSQEFSVKGGGEAAAILNMKTNLLRLFASELTRITREIGLQGVFGGQAVVPGLSGAWKELGDGLNATASRLTEQVRNIAEVIGAIQRGDFKRKVTVEGAGEILELKAVLNTLVDQLSAFAAEVSRLAREVEAEEPTAPIAVPNLTGAWTELIDDINSIVTNRTL